MNALSKANNEFIFNGNKFLLFFQIDILINDKFTIKDIFNLK